MDTPTNPRQYRPIGNASSAAEVAAAVNRLKQDSSDGGSDIIHKTAAFTAAADKTYTLTGFTGNATLPTDLADGAEVQLIYRDGTGSVTVTDATFSEILSVVGTTLTLRWDKGAWQAMEDTRSAGGEADLLVDGALTVTGTTTLAAVTMGGTGDVVPTTDSVSSLGTTGVRWADFFTDAMTCGGNASIGGFVSAVDGFLSGSLSMTKVSTPAIIIGGNTSTTSLVDMNASDASTTDFAFASAGVRKWSWNRKATTFDLVLQRWVGGSFVDNAVTVDNATGAVGIYGWTFAAHKQNLTDADLSAAATSEAVAITGFPANAKPIYARIEINTAFSGGSVSALTVEIGDAVDPNGKMTAEDCFTGASTGVIAGSDGAEADNSAVLEAAYSPIATFRSTSDNVDALDAGDLNAYVYYQAIGLT